VKPSEVHARLNDYVDGELTRVERAGIEAALGRDPELRREVDELRATVSMLRRLPEVEPPPFLAERVIARVRAGEAEPSFWWRWLGEISESRFLAPVAAGALALAIFGGLGSERLLGPEPTTSSGELLASAVPSRASEQVSGSAVARSPSGSIAARSLAAKESRLAGERLTQMRRRNTLALSLARQGQIDEVARILRGAGHPHSAGMAAHLEEPVFAFTDYSPRPRLRPR
jgi:anti-sigma factor RsiW